MIVAKQKSIDSLVRMIEGHARVLLVGCATCAAECAAGGEREVAEMGSALRIALRLRGSTTDVVERMVERQCELEFVENVAADVESADAVLAASCGIGVQTVGERFHPRPVYPALDTVFMGVREQPGRWVERCAACGDCLLDRTAGICPITRCAKSILNGPCGGTRDGKCEVDHDTDCAWHLIIERLRALGRLETLEEYVPPKDWSTGRDGGPRRLVREDLQP